MKKVIRPGRIINYGGGRFHPDIFCKIEYTEDGRLSISGVVGPRPNGNCVGSCGQIDCGFEHRNASHHDARYDNLISPKAIEFAEGWNTEKWYTFLEVWEVWHLNDLSAGCAHQKAFGWDKEPIDPEKPTTAYGCHYPGQKRASWNLKAWVYPPHGYLTKPCPICGYEYGTAWHKEEVPADVIEWLEGLPPADKTPAWV